MGITLTFIIPVYNVESYLKECIDSIMRQIKSSVEIILVDDGSTDCSGNLCDMFADSYEEITVIHKENGGLASARNAGLDIARGLYIAFVDSDDRIADGAVSGILEWIQGKNADVCFMNAIKFYPDGSSESLGDEIRQDGVRNKNKLQVMQYLAGKPKFPGSACTKIYKKSFLDKYTIRFPKDRRLHEDLYFTFRCIDVAQSYDSLEFPYYEYRQGRSGSITHGSRDRSIQDLCLFVEEMTNEYTSRHLPISNEAEYLLAFVAYEYSLILWRFCTLSEYQMKKTKPFLYRYKWVLDFNHTKRISIVRYTLKFLGIHMTSKCLNYIMRRKNR